MEMSPSPLKPSRQPKESTALLMSVIRSISSSESNEHRDKEKAKLEKEFKRSDAKLDELIANHHEDLTVVIEAFGKISSRLSTLREKIGVVKYNLANSKSLLNCRRDELKRLWLEGIEHKQTLFLLEQIENLKGVPERVEKYKQKRHYLHATELLVSSVASLESDLKDVEALKDVRNELQAKQQALHNVLIEDLHRHLYVRSAGECLLNWGAADASRGDGSALSPAFYSWYGGGSPDRHPTNVSPAPLLRRRLIEPTMTPLNLSSTPTHHKYRSQYKHVASASSSTPTKVDDTVVEDLLLSDPEEDSAHFLAILVESLALLNKISDTVETMKSRMQRELVHIVRRTSQLFADSGQGFSVELLAGVNQPHLLGDFLELIFEQFTCVAEAHENVLRSLRRLASSSDFHGDVQLYDMADYWSRVQAVLQVLLSDYLDIENSAATQRPTSTFVDTHADVALHFARRRPIKPKRLSFFKFESSSHSISLNNYLKEQQAVFGSDDMLTATNKAGEVIEKLFVCQPLPRNIMVIFIPLMKFIKDIESALGYDESSHCALHTFVTDFVANVFLGQVHQEAITAIELATKSMETWRACVDLETQKSLELPRPLLSSTVSVDKRVLELRDIMQSLPSHAELFLDMICNILASYKETCVAAYQGIVRSESEDKRIISATWAKDEDINRFLRSLPNWINLQNQKELESSTDIEESPEEVRLRNKKESDILTANLADTVIPAHEILSDVGHLKTLAMQQESLEWFGSRIWELANTLPTSSPNTPTTPTTPTNVLDLPPVSETSVDSLKDLARQFKNLAEMCLMVLHLEVRVHCFYYLLPVAKQSSFTSGVDIQDPDPEVVKLNKDLAGIDEALSACLQPSKFRYVFEGLGHLVASIIISSCQYVRRINDNGVKKTCRNIFAIQQNLTNITLSREVALDHARHYYELLYRDPEEILNEIVEHGAKFTELDYRNALQLLHRSRTGAKPADLEKQVKRLHEILNEVAVAI